MTQTFTPEMRKLVNKIDRNTRAIAKIASARAFVIDDDSINMQHQALVTDRLDEVAFKLIQERRNFRAALEDELHRQASWQKKA